MIARIYNAKLNGDITSLRPLHNVHTNEAIKGFPKSQIHVDEDAETTLIVKLMKESVLDRVLTELGVPVQGTKKDKIREFKIVIGL
jgi:hypothetical protein